MVTFYCVPKLYTWQQLSEESGPQHFWAQQSTQTCVESPSKSTGLRRVLSIKHKLYLLEISWTEALIILSSLKVDSKPVFFDENGNSQDIEALGSTP